MTVSATRGPAPDSQQNLAGRGGVKGLPEGTRSALDSGPTSHTITDRGQARTQSPRAPLLTSKEVAEILAVTEPTLARWRAEGRGPSWIELGHRVPRYLADDLDAWINLQRRGDVA